MTPKKTHITPLMGGLALSAALAFAASTQPAAPPAQQEPAPAVCCTFEAAATPVIQIEEIRLDSVLPAAIFSRLQGAPRQGTDSRSAVIAFPRQVTVGERVLPPGRYRVEHVSSGDFHFIRFTPLGEQRQGYEVVEVKCTLEPVQETVKRTLPRLRVEEDKLTLVKVYFAGERTAHAF